MTSWFYRLFRCSPKQAALAALIGFCIAVALTLFAMRDRVAPPAAENPAPAQWQPVSNTRLGYAFRLPPEFSLTAKQEDTYTRYEAGDRIVEVFIRPATSIEKGLLLLDQERATAYEGLPSVRIDQEEETTVAGQDAVTREILLNAAGFSAIETFVFLKGTVVSFSTLFATAEAIGEEERAFHALVLSGVTFP
ncbi:hypothetical protein A2398_05160 [Candidatus Peribacteria bacterium RIFOXYB1_FULL_57_12]|nr:MAG: hypothetical protein A2398_05160 [Candidatus Peribacteria bacterium RIFOXYB1_FULL_57_12]